MSPHLPERSISAVRRVLGATGLIACLGLSHAQDEQPASPFGSLEDLFSAQVEITSAAKKPQDPWTTPAAIHVLTQEDIRRSGATHVAEALRLVPGLHVVRQESHTWQIAARGFNGGFSNKMLVLIDGRSVYTPLFAGVYWDVQDLVLEDIDRIEVIRGPGGSVWGANAVNGVINIITKRSKDSQGTLTSVTLGTEDRYIATLRHGGSFGETGNYRVYAKSFDRDSTEFNGSEGVDDWTANRAGFRMDWEPGPDQEATFQGDIYGGKEASNRSVTAITTLPSPLVESRHSGGNALFRWTVDQSDESSWTVQTWYDRTDRRDDVFGEVRTTLDLEVTQRWTPNDTHDIVWGFGQRTSEADFNTNPTFDVNPDPRTTNILNVFAQDDIRVNDEFTLTLGNKFSRNNYTGWEVQPTIRGAWTPNEDTTIWAAASRAVRMPSTLERDATAVLSVIPDDGTVGFDQVIAVRPGDMDAERVYAMELGVRKRVNDKVTVDATAFYNDYDDLRTAEPETPVVINPTQIFLGFVPQNLGSGIARGAEVVVEIEATDDWDLDIQYSYMNLDLHKEAKSGDPLFTSQDDDAPHSILNIISHHDISDEWSLDAILIYVDDVPSPALNVDSFWRGDLRLAFQPDPSSEYVLGIQNLFHDGETETGVNEVEAAAYVKATKRF